ncbi:hypothetical protein AT728_33155 [Streptomyces silvensis]|uniref:Uncharacterized protein n=1 Tax=Streptomyces silvensis TaxID=1765722 RepID=A0A0W7WRW8_9ACTN|nr:hypothetical protein AT728_33155 [Streptomyces silvensis]
MVVRKLIGVYQFQTFEEPQAAFRGDDLAVGPVVHEPGCAQPVHAPTDLVQRVPLEAVYLSCDLIQLVVGEPFAQCSKCFAEESDVRMEKSDEIELVAEVQKVTGLVREG